MQCVVDSSVFVAAFRGGEVHSSQALALIKQIERGDLVAVVPFSVIVETTATMRRRTLSRAIAVRTAATLSKWLSPTTIMMLTDKDQSVVLEVAVSSGLRGMDVLVVATAVIERIPLVTLDREMARRARPFVDVLPLKELLNGH